MKTAVILSIVVTVGITFPIAFFSGTILTKPTRDELSKQKENCELKIANLEEEYNVIIKSHKNSILEKNKEIQELTEQKKRSPSNPGWNNDKNKIVASIISLTEKMMRLNSIQRIRQQAVLCPSVKTFPILKSELEKLYEETKSLSISEKHPARSAYNNLLCAIQIEDETLNFIIAIFESPKNTENFTVEYTKNLVDKAEQYSVDFLKRIAGLYELVDDNLFQEVYYYLLNPEEDNFEK